MYSRQLAKSVVVFLLVLTAGCSEADTNSVCDAPELMQGEARYNELVCEGIRRIEEGKFLEAERLFKTALSIRLYDSPNFELLPRLAWVRFKQGNIIAAKDDLLKSELSLSVFTGLVECKEADWGFYLKSNKSGLNLTGKVSDEVAEIMCGAAYDYIYRRESLDRVLLEADLVKRYLEVKKEIEGTNGKQSH